MPGSTGRSERDAPAGRPIEVRNLHPRLRLDPAQVVRALRRLDDHREKLQTPASLLGRAGGSETLSVVFVTDARLAALHGDFLDDPSATDVITFPADAGFQTAGEICVSADAAARMAGPARPFARELALYLVHGWLHLAGHDDREPGAKRRMRAAETRALAWMARSRTRLDFRWEPRPGSSCPCPVRRRR